MRLNLNVKKITAVAPCIPRVVEENNGGEEKTWVRTLIVVVVWKMILFRWLRKLFYTLFIVYRGQVTVQSFVRCVRDTIYVATCESGLNHSGNTLAHNQCTIQTRNDNSSRDNVKNVGPIATTMYTRTTLVRQLEWKQNRNKRKITN